MSFRGEYEEGSVGPQPHPTSGPYEFSMTHYFRSPTQGFVYPSLVSGLFGEGTEGERGRLIDTGGLSVPGEWVSKGRVFRTGRTD